MGRYAFFNTEFEYKFRFAFQPSWEMRAFGGTKITECEHSWTKTDLPYIIDILKNINDEDIDAHLIMLDTFQKNLEGTWEVSSYMKDNLSESENKYTYILGMLIYHQLQYMELLKVRYEL